MKWNRWLGIGLAVISAACLVISIWPIAVHSDQVSFSTPGGMAGLLVVTVPDQIHVGDKSYISLKLSVDQSDNQNSQLTILSKLEMDDLKVSPNGEGRVSIDPTKPVVLQWQVGPYMTGIYSGTLWLFLETNGGERDLILAKPIELKAKTLFGLSYSTARTVSIIGLIVGLGFCLVIINKKRSV